MNTNIATDRLQSARLLQCGVPADTADMCWRTILCPSNDEPWADPQLSVLPYTEAKDIYGDDYVEPAWSLSALLSLLPTSILSPLGNEYMLELSKLRMHNAWEVQWFYNSSRFTTYDKHKHFQKLWDKSPIEACVKAIEWLTSNGYKLNEQ